MVSGCAGLSDLSPGKETAEMKLVAVATVRSASAPVRRAKIVWTRFSSLAGGYDAADLQTPLGTTQARLEVRADGMRIFVGGEEVDAKDAGAEVQRWLAVLPPPRSFGYWLAGKSDPDYPTRELLAVGVAGVVKIYQHEWEVEFVERGEDGYPLHLKMRPQSSASAAEVEVRIRKWLKI